MIDVGEGTPPASRPLDLQALVSVPDEEDIAAGLSGTRTSEPTPAEGRKVPQTPPIVTAHIIVSCASN